MWNVIRAQMYQLIRDKMICGMFLFALALSGIFAFTGMVDWEGSISGSLVVAGMGNMFCISGVIILLIIVANTVGKDFTDKTLNYEILSGHSRKEVLFGRFITAAVLGMLCSFFIIVLIPMVFSMLFGWGTAMELQGVIIRYGLVFAALFRIACELTFIVILTKNPYLTYLIGFLSGYIQMMIPMVKQEFPDWFANKNSELLSIWHCMDLLAFQNSTALVSDELQPVLYQSSIEPSAVFLSIGTSLAAGGIMLVISYWLFQHYDLN